MHACESPPRYSHICVKRGGEEKGRVRGRAQSNRKTKVRRSVYHILTLGESRKGLLKLRHIWVCYMGSKSRTRQERVDSKAHAAARHRAGLLSTVVGPSTKNNEWVESSSPLISRPAPKSRVGCAIEGGVCD
jgi:hypothetical protein